MPASGRDEGTAGGSGDLSLDEADVEADALPLPMPAMQLRHVRPFAADIAEEILQIAELDRAPHPL